MKLKPFTIVACHSCGHFRIDDGRRPRGPSGYLSCAPISVRFSGMATYPITLPRIRLSIARACGSPCFMSMLGRDD